MVTKKNLGKWALIDIETTGIDHLHDAIIDIGYLQFEGTTLIKSYSSLVRTDHPLSQFIQKLTGIKEPQVRNAPTWAKVEPELMDLMGHALIAHNAAFEEKFLKKYFEQTPKEDEREKYCDSIHFLSLIFPEKSSLNLESFMIELGIADKEEHRGLADSQALLQVMLMVCYMTHQDNQLRAKLIQVLDVFQRDEFWFKNFFALSQDELLEIAHQIEFDLTQCFTNYLAAQVQPIVEAPVLELNQNDFSSTQIKEILQAESDIQKVIPNYKFRPAQEQLALRVGQAFNNGIHALIQAPTGTGKTIGYLIPSALFAKAKKEQVLVATGTKTLQKQAVDKDIPQLYKILGLSEQQLKITHLVGSSNHLCELMYYNKEQEVERDLLGYTDYASKFIKAYFAMVFFYNQRVEPDQGITRDQLPFVLKKTMQGMESYEKDIAVDYRACTGQNCPFKNECSYLQSLRKAKDSDIIIGNHSLMMMWPRSFPRAAHIVVDEAHKLENEATKTFTLSFTQKSLESFASNVNQQVGPLYYLLGNFQEENNEAVMKKIREEVAQASVILKDHLEPFADNIEKFFKKLPRFSGQYWNEVPAIKKANLNDALSAAIHNHFESMTFVFNNLYALLKPFQSHWDPNTFQNEKGLITAYTAFESFLGLLEDLTKVMNTMLEASEDYCHSMKYLEDFGYQFEAAPIDVGKILYEELLSQSSSVVFTSATLANASGSSGINGVEWMTGYSYLASEKRFKSGLFLEEVYDYKNKAKVYIASDTPALYDYNFVGTVMEKLVPTIRALQGRTLLLFSAKVRFEKAVEVLLTKFEGELPVFVQGMGHNVVEEFKKSENGILVGMESFGEGIDIPGNSLQFIYIDKIPDLRQDLIINERRAFYDKKFGNEFNDYFLAHRTRSLHQKLGRLIRTESDRGGILITDNRIKSWKQGTLATFKKLMEPYELHFEPMDKALANLVEFIGEA